MKRLALLFLSLLLLCGCAPQMGEEKPSFSPPTLEEERGETTEGEAVVHPLDQKILLDFDSREEFATDSVRVTLKASASDHLDPPTKEDFPGIDLSRIEYLVTGGYDTEKGKDWDTYFSVPERKPEYFRWRLRLYFENPSEQTARDAVDVLNKMPEVAEIETHRMFPRWNGKIIFDSSVLRGHRNNALHVTFYGDCADPNVPYAPADFPELPVLEVKWVGEGFYDPEAQLDKNGIEQSLLETYRLHEEMGTIHTFYRHYSSCIVELVFPPSSDKELERYANLLYEREDVSWIDPCYVENCTEQQVGSHPVTSPHENYNIVEYVK
ncbi:MAG: hypothetical protein IJF24_05100 [Clostridia bacterium]|nr:hypothetical protein [Clostridia bacterium]